MAKPKSYYLCILELKIAAYTWGYWFLHLYSLSQESDGHILNEFVVCTSL